MTEDISELLETVKKDIALVEGGDESPERLSELGDVFERMLELIKLFLISERDSYYGYFLISMSIRTDFYSDAIAGILLNTFPPVFSCNPLLLGKFTLKEIIYIVCHEIDHVVFNHPAEMVKAAPDGDPEKLEKFNLAADAAVNDRIDDEIIREGHGFMSPPDGRITSPVLSEMFALGPVRPLENYAYYYDLIRDRDFAENHETSAQAPVPRQKGGPGGNQQDGQRHVVTEARCRHHVRDHGWEAGEDAEEAAAAVRQAVNSAVDVMNEETRSMMPGEFTEQVELLNQPPEISWQAILKKYIGTIPTGKHKTRSRLNRRQPERFDLSGAVDEKTLKIVVAIDTSGSVEDEEIARIFNEIFEILARRKHDITVIECDAAVQRVYKARTAADIKKKVKGRGGTLFTPVIEYINSHRYYRDALLIYFTDGFGEDSIPRPLTYRNIWVVFDDPDNLSPEEPYGIKLKL